MLNHRLHSHCQVHTEVAHHLIILHHRTKCLAISERIVQT